MRELGISKKTLHDISENINDPPVFHAFSDNCIPFFGLGSGDLELVNPLSIVNRV
jgi:hypothetical protein